MRVYVMTSDKYLPALRPELLPLVAEAHQRRPGDLLRFLLRREAAALGIKIEDDGKLAGASASEAE
jgi:hypothetical protein